LTSRDVDGENPLFMAARVGDVEIFKWYSGNIDFFKARGEQNLKGQTIEHIVCLERRHEIVDVIKPRPDTKDYYGNLPIFYSI
jgi:ankyrin repeat protein